MNELRQDIYRLVRQAFIELEVTVRQLMSQYNLSATQYWALMYLKDTEGLPLSELAFLLMQDKSNMTNLADRLEKEGLAIRKFGKNGDRRYIRIVLTEQGQHVRSQMAESYDALVNKRLERLSEESLFDLRHRLQELINELQIHSES